ncbi:YopX family protein [Streptococcus suis]|uniref:YopX family protein n=1 Tax=Streptococcus suis TaxID=1307 RepID=UPI00211BB84D|nr:YopX family protein [Streptococcus suis]MCQ9227206.1 YopX family protein [Streptococcus suis]MCQ9229477.1 YopX family protein [Streptococcus suis]MCQ9243480.1 YopX family protein [Streptococcus suis]MCQ9275759.1 YopX family protein [Streptococcus suis]MDE7535840.1 YopX family protein [Streptococcus suis]
MTQKFRAWDKASHAWRHDIYIGLDGLAKDLSRTGEEPFELPLDDVIIMQSTGLFDVNGKEVYIGDIVKCTVGCSHEVIFLKEYGGRYIGGMPAIYLSDIRDGYAWTEDEEVIGNIYENPELVEVVTND